MRMKIAAAALGLVMLLANAVQGQDARRSQPQNGNGPSQTGSTQQSESSSSASKDRHHADALRGVLITDDLQAVKIEQLEKSNGLDVVGMKFLSAKDVEPIVSPYLGQAVTDSSIRKMIREIITYCQRRKDKLTINCRWVEDAYLPSTNNFVVLLEFTDAKLRSLKVVNEGTDYFSTNLIRRYFRSLTEEKTISASRLFADLDWANRNNSYRDVQLRFVRPTAEANQEVRAGYTDAELSVNDRFPMRGYAGYENTGNRFVGVGRVVAGLGYGNLWGQDHQVNYQFTSDAGFEFFTAHALSYVAPIGPRQSVAVFGSYSTVSADLSEFNLGKFKQDGESYQLSFRYNLRLPNWRSIEHEASIGFDFKHADNSLEFNLAGPSDEAVLLASQPFDIGQINLSYNALRRDSWGTSQFEANFFFGPGLGDDAEYEAVRPFSDPVYFYGQLQFSRYTPILSRNVVEKEMRMRQDKLAWVFRILGQFASENLLPSEQLGVGGFSSVRGYEERAANADMGGIINNELQWTVFERGSWLLKKGYSDFFWRPALNSRGDHRLVTSVFVDYGYAAQLNDDHVSPDSEELLSAGVGLRYEFGRNVSFRGDFGYQLKELKSPTADTDDWRFHFGVTVGF
ncbi:MAG: ShlB/FhaC/HecB family hemolysin secretion/activation protein [Verrucomicrobiales bacterium]|nr:ShlB/FhaC/HecB family hemolysin secretion/activation protein [Verrucomicrobiales bacterium]